MTYPVTSVDGLWLQVRNGNENDFHQDLTRTIASRSERAYANQVPPLPIIATTQHAQIINHIQQQLQHSQHNGFLNNNNVTKKSQLAYASQHHNNNNNNNHLKSKDKQPAKEDADCTSDSSSTRRGDRFRRRGSNAPSESGRGAKSKKCSTAGSEDGSESVGNVATGVKKPIIAKLKAGVKLQIPTRSQNDELLEGLKRAQRSRLEDQRGTEINFELPDFLKDKENFTSTTTPVGSSSASTATTMAAPSSKFTRKFGKRPESAEFPLGTSTNGGSLQQIHKPQPAPRLSISRGATATASGANPSSPVQSASSESNLNNLSLRCNASPLTLDDNGNGSQSENSYAEATMIFTHASANAHQSPASSPPSSANRYHHLDSGSAADHHHYEAIDGDGSTTGADLVDGGVIYHPPYHRHPHHNHHHNHLQQQQHHLSASTSSGSSTGSSTSSSGSSSSSSSSDADNQKGPPPLPPKPKILPIKPSNWGHSAPATGGSGMSASMCNLSTASGGGGGGGGGSSSQNGVCGSNNSVSVSSNNSGKEKRLSGADQKQAQAQQQQSRSVYLDHASSSFV